MVKPLLSQGMRRNWQKNLAHRFFCKRAIKMVIRDAELFIGDTTGTTMKPTYTKKMFHKYKRWEQIHGYFLKGIPISVIVLQDGYIGALVDDRHSWLVVPICIQDCVERKSGLEYFRVSMFEHDATGSISRRVVNFGTSVDVATFAILLPSLKDTNYKEGQNHTWTIVGAEYERLSRAGQIQGAYDLPINLQTSDNVDNEIMYMDTNEDMEDVTDAWV